jgi:hypothetical protein
MHIDEKPQVVETGNTSDRRSRHYQLSRNRLNLLRHLWLAPTIRASFVACLVTSNLLNEAADPSNAIARTTRMFQGTVNAVSGKQTSTA